MIGNGGEYAALDLADCRHHRVDWRARALAAEAALDEIARLVSPACDPRGCAWPRPWAGGEVRRG